MRLQFGHADALRRQVKDLAYFFFFLPPPFFFAAFLAPIFFAFAFFAMLPS
jgi:hypothetical protein